MPTKSPKQVVPDAAKKANNKCSYFKEVVCNDSKQESRNKYFPIVRTIRLFFLLLVGFFFGRLFGFLLGFLFT